MIWTMVAGILLRIRDVYWRTVYRAYRSRYEVAPTFRFNGTGTLLYGNGRIRLGADSYVGSLCSIQVDVDTSVSIGVRCSISHNVRIYTVTNQAGDDPRVGAPQQIKGDVVIGDGVWVGANCYIGPGIRIGSNVVVVANSVVTRSIPDGEIWGGVPARLIRRKGGAG